MPGRVRDISTTVPEGLSYPKPVLRPTGNGHIKTADDPPAVKARQTHPDRMIVQDWGTKAGFDEAAVRAWRRAQGSFRVPTDRPDNNGVIQERGRC